MFLFGAILAKIYTFNGAADSIAESVCEAISRGANSLRKRYALEFLTVIISSAVLCHGGTTSYCGLAAGIASSLAEVTKASETYPTKAEFRIDIKM